MEGREDYWWTFERGQALLDRISQLESRLEELLSDKGLESVPRLVNLNDARAILGGVSRATIYRWIDDGELQSVRLGGRRMILLSSMRRMLARCGLVPA